MLMNPWLLVVLRLSFKHGSGDLQRMISFYYTTTSPFLTAKTVVNDLRGQTLVSSLWKCFNSMVTNIKVWVLSILFFQLCFVQSLFLSFINEILGSTVAFFHSQYLVNTVCGRKYLKWLLGWRGPHSDCQGEAQPFSVRADEEPNEWVSLESLSFFSSGLSWWQPQPPSW